jgi:hypothetical protein
MSADFQLKAIRLDESTVPDESGRYGSAGRHRPAGLASLNALIPVPGARTAAQETRLDRHATPGISGRYSDTQRRHQGTVPKILEGPSLSSSGATLCTPVHLSPSRRGRSPPPVTWCGVDTMRAVQRALHIGAVERSNTRDVRTFVVLSRLSPI